MSMMFAGAMGRGQNHASFRGGARGGSSYRGRGSSYQRGAGANLSARGRASGG